MKLQIALDCLETGVAVDLCHKVERYVDIIEVGTPLLKHEGMKVVEALRALFPEHELLVDAKTMDAGAYESEFMFAAGADYVTVLGVADPLTIAGVAESANKYGGKAVVDLIQVPDKMAMARTCHEVGAALLMIHTGIDQQQAGGEPFSDLANLSSSSPLPVGVAGGINLGTLDNISPYSPAVVVVGGALTGAEDPGRTAAEFQRILQERSA